MERPILESILNRKITIILLKKDLWHQHLMYVIDDKILINPIKNNILLQTGFDCNVVDRLKNKSILGYKMVASKTVKQNIKKYNQFMNLHFYNCISIGKILLNMNGIYFSCSQFFNKIQER